MAEGPWDTRRQTRARRILKRAWERPSDGFIDFFLPLRAGEELSVAGCVDIRVVRGQVQVWGARLQPSQAFQRIVAPPWGALPRLFGEASGKEECAADDEDIDVREFLAQHSWPIVMCARLVTRPSSCNIGEGDSQDTDLREELRSAFLLGEERPRLCAHQSWPSLSQNFLALRGSATAADSAWQPQVLLVVGAKNVGKSTCCRYFVNTLLSAVGEVFFLETDLGQPELTPPGLISLHRICAPLLNFSQAAQPDERNKCLVSLFVGGTTPAVHPILYARSVRAAVDAYVEVCQKHPGPSPPPPLVVNSHGWLTGLGLELVHAVLRAVRPQLVIRIGGTVVALEEDSAADDSGFTLKRKRSLLARCGPLTQGLLEASARAEEEAPSVLVDVESIAKSSSSTVRPRSVREPLAGELRWLRFAAYFRGDMDPCKPPMGFPLRSFFEPLPRTRLPLRRLRFGLVHGPLPPGEIEATFTGTIVALCSLRSISAAGVAHPCVSEDDREIGHHPEGTCPVVELGEDVVARCVALAFVHAFDTTCNELVVYVAGPPAALESVDCVLRGDIQWEPHSVRGQQVVVEHATSLGASPMQPFCSSWVLEGLAVGARAPTTRTNLKRRRLEGRPKVAA
eukprot:CAMPEP_0204128750 /NCGR_PEP_ID=MMETSP0361-20130328/12368_1 /ASSEMBLY_ACC=CAM_ASM_000343 /TAXON_ID=268821 /ORGANISM="Scrippsiella Hangoei, Strain SHTV-5" /LENGTH=624 /DNA_ID=CAMNT_0051081047 /DNA_START=35 /DNA_END=1909 /DNA_ORIENTATION=-